MRSLNYAMIARTLCFLLLFEAGFMIVPIIVAIVNDEFNALRVFSFSMALTGLVGLSGYFFIKPARRELSKYDNVLLTALVWIVFSFFGLVPYMLVESCHLNFSQAYFEAMSGFTTTGASLIPSADSLDYAIHMWRCLTEWIGGLGIIIFTLALVPMLNSSGGVQMFNAEQNKVGNDKVSPRISTTARKLWGVYIMLTLVLFGLLCFGPMTPFEAACHSLSTLSTGGISTTSSGINDFSTLYVKILITIFMFLGGVNFSLVYCAAMGKPRALFHNETFLTYCKVIGVATVVFIIGICNSHSAHTIENVTIDPLFQVVSFITSTGFMLTEFNYWGPGLMAVALLLIFAGGCAGSTSGGAKIDRIVYLFKFLRNEIKRTLRPNAVLPVRVSRRVIPSQQVSKVVAFLFLYVIVSVVGSLALSILNVPIEDAFISSMAAMGNSSLSISDTSLGADYQNMGPAAHYILSTLMLIGRLEIFTILVLLSPGFWRK